MEFCITAEQLRKALADIERAEKRGFQYCLAVFRMSSAGWSVSDNLAEYSDMLERAHPTDGALNWGRFQGVTRGFRFRGGKLVKDRKASK